VPDDSPDADGENVAEKKEKDQVSAGGVFPTPLNPTMPFRERAEDFRGRSRRQRRQAGGRDDLFGPGRSLRGERGSVAMRGKLLLWGRILERTRLATGRGRVV